MGNKHSGHVQTKEQKRRRINAIGVTNEQLTSFIYNITETEEHLWVRVGGVLVQMMIDSGSHKNIMDEQTWRHLVVQGLKMRNVKDRCGLTFKPYGSHAEPLKVVKVFDADITVQDTNKQLKEEATFYVVTDGSQTILGRKTAKSLGMLFIGLPSTQKCDVQTIESLDKRSFPKIKGVKLRIPIDKHVSPVSQHARRPPLALLPRIEEKLNDLQKAEAVSEYSQWLSPLVPIVKDNGELRLCVDMRRANEAILRENHLMPTFEDFLPQLRKAKFFSRLDVKEAFHQVELEESCRYITTFITHKGVYRYRRLMFGVSCAPEMFQRIMEQILAECDNVINYIDDILVFGETELEHDKALSKVLEVLKSRNVLWNHAKCV